jgi:hypothetical protein
VSHTPIAITVYDRPHGRDSQKRSVVMKPSRGTRPSVGIGASCFIHKIYEAVS